MALGVSIVSSFDSSGITKAIKDFKKLEGVSKKTEFGLKTMDKAVTNGVKNLAKYGSIAAGIGGVIGSNLVAAAMESQKMMKQTEAIIKATGGAANVTSKQISELSDTLSKQAGVDDEVIQKSANLLLTFKQVQNQAGEGNQIFDRAMQSVLDLGSVFGSTDSAAMQLGKALSDPVKGVGALARAGINFSKAQKEQIKALVESGNTLEAQKLILIEVESQVGGTAAATATAFDRMKVEVGNFAEEIGTVLLPIVEELSNWVTNTALPKFREFKTVLGKEGIAGALKMLGTESMNAIGKLQGWGALIYGVVAAVVALKVAMVAFTVAQTMATIATAAFGVAWNASGIGLVVAGIGLAVVAIGALMIKFKGFREFLVGAFKKAIQLVLGYWEFWINAFIKGLNFLIKAYNKLPFVSDLGLVNEVNFSFGEDKGSKRPTRIGAFADGGIVTQPMLGLVGEAGPEAIIPLSEMQNMNMGGGGTHITVQTGVGDPVAIGKAVVEALQAYQRRAGALPLRVA